MEQVDKSLRADGPAKVAENDLPNARIVAERSRPADLVLNGAG